MGRISRPGLTGGAGRPLGAWSPRGGVYADAHKKIRGKTPKGEASFGLPTFLSEWGGRRAACKAALNPRKAAAPAAQRCRPAALRVRRAAGQAALRGAQSCRDGRAGLPWRQRRAALRKAALLPRKAALRPRRAASLCELRRLAAALHPVTAVGRGPGVGKAALGVEGHCRVADASRVAAPASDAALIRVRAGLHLRTSGPSQPRADRPAPHGTAPVRAHTASRPARHRRLPRRPRLQGRLARRRGARPPCPARRRELAPLEVLRALHPLAHWVGSPCAVQ